MTAPADYTALLTERDALRVQVRALTLHVGALVTLAVRLNAGNMKEEAEREKIIAAAQDTMAEAREAVSGGS